MSSSTRIDPSDQRLREARARLERRLRAGEECRAEDYLRDYADLGAHREAVIELILAEYRVRLEMGQEAVAEDLCRRFPQWDDSLRERLLFHELMPSLFRSPTPVMPGEGAVSEARFHRYRPGAEPAPDASALKGYELLEEIARGGSS